MTSPVPPPLDSTQLGVCKGTHDVNGGIPAYQSDSGWCFSCHNGNLLHYDQAVLWQRDRIGHIKIANVSGLTDVDANAPYTVAMVKLNEGPMITAQLTDLGDAPVEIGMPVEMVTRKMRNDGDERGVILYGYKFRPVLVG